MDYLQQLVYQAMSRNPDLDESYARHFAETRISQPIDLTRLDFDNLDLLAEELGCTPAELDTFVMITKAIWNGGQCEYTAAEGRAYAATVRAISSAQRGD